MRRFRCKIWKIFLGTGIVLDPVSRKNNWRKTLKDYIYDRKYALKCVDFDINLENFSGVIPPGPPTLGRATLPRPLPRGASRRAQGLRGPSLVPTAPRTLIPGYAYGKSLYSSLAFHVFRSGLRGGRAGPPPRAPRFGGPRALAPWRGASKAENGKVWNNSISQLWTLKLSMKFTNVRHLETEFHRNENSNF